MSAKGTMSAVGSPLEAVVLDIPALDQFFLDWGVRSLRRILLGQLEDSHQRSCAKLTDIIFKYLRPLAHFAAVLATNGQTPSVRLLGVKRIPRPLTPLQERAAPKKSRLSLFVYAMLSALLPTAYAEVKDWHRQRIRQRLAAGSRESTLPSGSRSMARVAAERQFQAVDIFFQTMEKILPMVRLLALLGVWSGRLGTSEVAMLLTGWTYRKVQKEPRLQVDYAHRRWLWEELSRSVRVWGQGMLLMAVWEQDWESWKDYMLTFLRKQPPPIAQETTEGSCPPSCCFCESRPMVMPLRLRPCGHTACYACFYERQSTGSSSVRCRLCKSRLVSASHLHSWMPSSTPSQRTL
jgi:hypothetical protein